MTKRITLSLLFLIAIFSLASCEKDPPVQSLEIRNSEATNITSQGGTFTVEITSSGSWYIRSLGDWCWPSVTSGTGDATVTINVEGNLTTADRSTNLEITSQGVSKEIAVSQKAGNGAEFHYKMPVVFHIIYKDASSSTQNVKKGHMASLLTRVNSMYKNSNSDMNVEFVPATIDPQGKTMEEPGVERILWNDSYPINPSVVMGNGSQFKSLLWDPNRYINVLVYAFSDDYKNVLGIGHMAITPTSHALEGTTQANVSYITLKDLNYAHCVSINSNYIYQASTAESYNTSDAVVTLTHELGHHLGLYHTFTEDHQKGTVDDCFDSDFCTDTPSYNRVQYESWLDNYLNTEAQPSLKVMIKRTACDGTEFEARNIMDYYMCVSDSFSAGQRARVRHVLTYGLLMPGPKIRDTKLGVNTKGTPLDLPIVYME